jgi:hypothetical protein
VRKHDQRHSLPFHAVLLNNRGDTDIMLA